MFVVTPWELHAPMCIAAMKAGAHAFCEVPIAVTVQEMWDIVNTSETTGRHCMMMENVNYGREELLYLNMVRQGLFGDLLHLQGGYQHDLRGVKFNDGKTPYDSGVEFGEKGYSEARWRTQHAIDRNGVLYPTHGIGPLAIGYLLWEVALAKARVHSLSMLAAATPVLSTLLLCVFLRSLPGPGLIAAAVLVSAGVLLSVRE